MTSLFGPEDIRAFVFMSLLGSNRHEKKPEAAAQRMRGDVGWPHTRQHHLRERPRLRAKRNPTRGPRGHRERQSQPEFPMRRIVTKGTVVSF